MFCRKPFHLPVALACALTMSAPAFAAETLLTIRTSEAERSYDIEALEQLGPVEFVTTTIWTEGPQHFTGVPLKALLADAGILEGEIRAIALNDYAIEMSVTDAMPDADGDGPVVAYMMNEQRMHVRDKRPLWLVYPYDQKPEFCTEVVYSRSIWQLGRIEQVD